MKLSKKNKKRLLFSSLVIIAVILISVSVVLLTLDQNQIPFLTSKKEEKKTQTNVEIVEIQKPANQDTTRQQAVDATIEQFKRLGENVKEQDLKVDIITRNGQQYYYIKSAQNSIKIEVKTGKVVMINSVSL
jgi:hypothetical protein